MRRLFENRALFLAVVFFAFCYVWGRTRGTDDPKLTTLLAVLTVGLLIWAAGETMQQRKTAQQQYYASVAPVISGCFVSSHNDNRFDGVAFRNLGNGPALDVELLIDRDHEHLRHEEEVDIVVNLGPNTQQLNRRQVRRERIPVLSAGGATTVQFPALFVLRSGTTFSLTYRDLAGRTIKQRLIQDDRYYPDGFRVEGWTG